MQPIHLFTFNGIPVSFSPFFLLLIVVLSFGWDSLVQMIIFAVCAILGILIHEFGHALMARRYGLAPQIVLHGLGGATQHVPTSSARQDFLITLCGPMAGLLFGGSAWAILKFIEMSGIVTAMHPYFYTFVYLFAYINILWGVFNLIPIRPMDGAKILEHILSKLFAPSRAQKIGIVISALCAVALFVVSLLSKNMFMILLSAYFVIISLSAIHEMFQSRDRGRGRAQKMSSLRAEGLYERGRVAAQNHDWNALETLGYQMKRAAESRDQLKRAYELIAIAATNLGKYDEALEAIPRARQTDAIEQAKIRCQAMLREKGE